jgi:hypothetical protein
MPLRCQPSQRQVRDGLDRAMCWTPEVALLKPELLTKDHSYAIVTENLAVRSVRRFLRVSANPLGQEPNPSTMPNCDADNARPPGAWPFGRAAALPAVLTGAAPASKLDRSDWRFCSFCT